MALKIYDDSKNYTCQVVKLTELQDIPGLDNLKGVNIQGNICLIGKDTDINELHLFFPAECQISHDFLRLNNLYRHVELNVDVEKKGFFEDNRRCKSIKFKGVISTGFVCPISFLDDFCYPAEDRPNFKAGQEFNELNGTEVCRKYLKKIPGNSNQAKQARLLDKIVDSKHAPEHFDTEHLLKNVHRLSLEDYVAITYKLHGTSARYFNTLTKRKVGIGGLIAKKFGIKVVEEEHKYVSASRKVIKSVDFQELPGKNHFYAEDLWTKVGEKYFRNKLHSGEAVYCEIIGRDYKGGEIQKGYSYGLLGPKVYIYRISHINPQGIEIDLSYHQMKQRAKELGIDTPPEFFYGTVNEFILLHSPSHIALQRTDRGLDPRDIEPSLNAIFYECLLEKDSIVDPTVIEEGFCIRVDKYPKPEIFKIKSKKFLLHESSMKDEGTVDIEEDQPVEADDSTPAETPKE